MDEIQKLKEKLKKKNEALKKANKKILLLSTRYHRNEAHEHAQSIRRNILDSLCSHIPTYVYEVHFLYNKKPYMEKKIESYGNKWLKDDLRYYLADEKEIIAWNYEIEITAAKKLW